MRTLKRSLALILVLVLAFGCVSGALAAGVEVYDDVTDKTDIINEEAVALLIDLGIVNGYEDGTFRATNAISRAEFCKLVVYMMVGADAAATINNQPSKLFTDVNNTEAVWAGGYIDYLANKGIVAGDGGGIFRPLDTITAQEAAKILLTVLGWIAADRGYLGDSWALQVNVDAQREGIYAGFTAGKSTTLSRDYAALLIFNSLDARRVGLSKDTGLYETDSVGSFLTEMKIERVAGTVLGNEYASLTGTAAATGLTQIDVDGTVTTFAVASSVDQLGSKVAFYRYTVGAKKILSSYVASTGGTSVVAVDTGGTSYNAMKSRVSYATTVAVSTNFGSSIDLTAANITSGTTNGGWSSTVNPTLIPGRGKIVTYYDLTGDGKVDTINIVEYTLTQVTAKSASSLVVEGSGTTSSRTFGSDYVLNGFGGVAKDDYALYYKVGSYIIDIQVAETLTGAMTQYSSSAVWVDGSSVSKSALSNAASKLTAIGSFTTLTSGAVFYVDQAGYIIAATTDVTATAQYLYVLDADVKYGSGAFGNNYVKMSVVLGDGTQAIVDVAVVAGTAGGYYLSGAKDIAGCVLDNDLGAKLVGEILSYTVNGSGEYVIAKSDKLNSAANVSTIVKNSTATSSGTIKASAVAVGGVSSAYANSSTVLVFANPVGTPPDYYTLSKAYTGYANFPTYDFATSGNSAKVRYAYSGTSLLFVVVEAAAPAAVTTNYAVLTSANVAYTTSAGTFYNVMIDGTKQAILGTLSGSPAAGIVEYTGNATDGYTIKTATGIRTGVVDAVYSTFVVIEGSAYYFDDDYRAYDENDDYGTTTLAAGDVVDFVTGTNTAGNTTIVVALVQDYDVIDIMAKYTEGAAVSSVKIAGETVVKDISTAMRLTQDDNDKYSVVVTLTTAVAADKAVTVNVTVNGASAGVGTIGATATTVTITGVEIEDGDVVIVTVSAEA